MIHGRLKFLHAVLATHTSEAVPCSTKIPGTPLSSPEQCFVTYKTRVCTYRRFVHDDIYIAVYRYSANAHYVDVINNRRITIILIYRQRRKITYYKFCRGQKSFALVRRLAIGRVYRAAIIVTGPKQVGPS